MSSVFHSLDDVWRHLEKLDFFHMDMGLERVLRALSVLRPGRLPFVTVQVLGTNGKGSTSAFLASLAKCHGCRVGLYTSPHFVSPMERIRICDPGKGSPAPDKQEHEEIWLASANAVRRANPDLTYFEFLTVLALEIFSRHGVDLAVLEAGLGGRHDATTAAAADVLCYTPIAMDHQDVLGTNLAAIAADKAGAVHAGCAAVCSAKQYPEAAKALAASTRAHGVPLLQAEPASVEMPLGLAGAHQQTNAGLALAAWQVLAPLLGRAADDLEKQRAGLRCAFFPGRFQHVPASSLHPPLLLDGAHNPHSMVALLKGMRAEGISPAGAVFSCLADKNWLPGLRLLKHFLGDVPIFVPALSNRRAVGSEEIALACNRLPPATAIAMGQGGRVLEEILLQGRALPGIGADRPLLVTGSLYLLAEFFALHPAWLVPAVAQSQASGQYPAGHTPTRGCHV